MVVLVPEQIVVDVAVAVPPMLTGFTVTEAVVEFAEAHTPLVKTAL